MQSRQARLLYTRQFAAGTPPQGGSASDQWAAVRHLEHIRMGVRDPLDLPQEPGPVRSTVTLSVTPQAEHALASMPGHVQRSCGGRGSGKSRGQRVNGAHFV